MKYLYTLIAIAIFSLTSEAQRINDSAVYGMAYANQVHYQLDDGSRTTSSQTNWDFQIYTDLFEESIIINGGNGAQLYSPANDDTTDWATLDTTGMSPLYNSDTSWTEGAFESEATGHPDYGWGDYSSMGNLTGKRIFVLKTVSGTWKKVWIKELRGFGTVYDIRIADLNGSNDTTVSIDKSAYPTKQFFYYEVESNTVRDMEPAKGDWDLIFRRFQTTVAPGQTYPVTGVLHNIGVSVAEAQGVDPETVTDQGLTYTTAINEIGYDWKSSMLVIDTARAYFVRDLDGDIWKLVFTGFASGFSPPMTGTAFFWKELVTPATGIQSVNGVTSEFTLYPNPAVNSSNILFNSDESIAGTIEVFDLSGRAVMTYEVEIQEGLNNFRISTESLSSGNYIVRLSNGLESIQEQLFVAQ